MANISGSSIPLLLRPRRIVPALMLIIFLLATTNISFLVAKFHYGLDSFVSLRHWLDVGEESNLPTWFNSFILLLAAVLLAMVSQAKFSTSQPYRGHWRGLAAIFLYMSVDESTRLHEQLLNRFMNWITNGHEVMTYQWVIPAAIITAAIGLMYLRFLWHLPPWTRKLFMLACAVYVGSAAGIEAFEGWYFDHYPHEYLKAGMLVVAEESGEMLGITLFIYAILDYAGRQVYSYQLVFGEPEK